MVHYELLKLEEMVHIKRYQQQLTDLRRSLLEKLPERGRTERGNIKSFFFITMFQNKFAKQIRDTLAAFGCEVSPHAAYSPHLVPFDYDFFASMSHALAEQRFGSYENVKKRLDESFAADGEGLYWRSIHKLFER